MRMRVERWLDRWIGGHITIGPITVYGRNAMHFAVNIRTRWGWVCLKPPTRCFGMWWGWYFYVSPDATPGSATVLYGRRD